ncbi:MAG TPA: cupredoxin domain-containing protein [Candidatus Deferrimicrobium sp.]|nr:cupredoxin domain-containing protein [Candidatus Deferrimicrobium sp.]
MRTPSLPLVMALLAVALVVAACASETGSSWTYAPLTSQADEVTMPAEPVGPAQPEVTPTAPASDTPAGPTTPAEPVEAATSPAPAAPPPATPLAPAVEPAADGEPRIIELESTASLLFQQEGERIPDIPLTPGETVRFRIDNTAGFGHNFYVGQDEELNVPFATTEVGIPVWESGVQELEWRVPDDVSGLKFGCTVPGHYFTQQGIFSVAP